MSNNKGSRTERELVNLIDEYEEAQVMRAPASGAGTDRELPDILFGTGHCFIAIEAKASSSDKIYLDEEEVNDLLYFADNFGASPRIGVRFDEMDWYFFEIDESLYRTRGGNYRISKEKAKNAGQTLEELMNESIGIQ